MPGRVGVPVPVALRFAYDGTAFDSYARQTGDAGRTVEGALLAALTAVGAVPAAGAAALRSASRTDRGVSARENVVAFRSRVPPDRLPGALLGQVAGLWPIAATAVAPGFEPRRARRREYRYFLAPDEVEATPAALAGVLAVFRGRHDFGAFARLERGRGTVRVIEETDVLEVGPALLAVRIVGPSFLWQQVRRIMAAALSCCRGETDAEALGSMLRRGRAAIDEAGRFGVAPAERLVLWRVEDPRLRFNVSPQHAARLEERRRAAWTTASARAAWLAAIGGAATDESPAPGAPR